VEADTAVLTWVVDPLSGRSLLSRVEAFFAQHDTAVHAATVGRARARRDDLRARQRFTACAGRAITRVGMECRSVPLAPTSQRGWGASQGAAAQAMPGDLRRSPGEAPRPAGPTHWPQALPEAARGMEALCAQCQTTRQSLLHVLIELLVI